MVSGNHTVPQAAAAAGLDAESAEWLEALGGTGPRRESALARLHEMLVRIARGEVGRRGPRLRVTGPELEDLAYQAAADALLTGIWAMTLRGAHERLVGTGPLPAD